MGLRGAAMAGLLSLISSANAGPCIGMYYAMLYGDKASEVSSEKPKTMEDMCTISESEMIPFAMEEDEAVLPRDFSQPNVERIRGLHFVDVCKLMDNIKTIEDINIYCTRVLVHGGAKTDNDRWGQDYWASLKVSHQFKVMDCDDGAIAGICFLENQGRKGYFLCLDGYSVVPIGKMFAVPRRFGHAICVYKTQDGSIGSIGINETDIQLPKAKSIDEFLGLLSESTKDIYTSYKIYDLGKVIPDLAENDRNNKVY